MGGENAKPLKLENEFINHPKFQDVDIVKAEESHHKLMRLRVPIHGQRMIKSWELGLMGIKNFKKEGLLVPKFHSFQSQGICGTAGILNIFFEYYPYLLSQEIKNRKGIDKQFDQNEVWYILFMLTSAAQQYHRHEQKLGDIRPVNVFISEEGRIKVANVNSWPQAETNYYASLISNQQTYLAPEQLEQLEKGAQNPESSKVKCEAFSIGLTVLDCMLLEDSSNFYNFNSHKFFEDRLKSALSAMKSQPRYSGYLKGFVSQLCSVNPNVRTTASNVYQALEPYQNNIQDLKDFPKPVEPASLVEGSKGAQMVPESRLSAFNRLSDSPNTIKPQAQGHQASRQSFPSPEQYQRTRPSQVSSSKIDPVPSNPYHNNFASGYIPSAAYTNSYIYSKIEPNPADSPNNKLQSKNLDSGILSTNLTSIPTVSKFAQPQSLQFSPNSNQKTYQVKPVTKEDFQLKQNGQKGFANQAGRGGVKQIPVRLTLHHQPRGIQSTKGYPDLQEVERRIKQSQQTYN